MKDNNEAIVERESHVGVLFADIQNVSRLEDEEVEAYVNEILTPIADIVDKYERNGTKIIDLNTWGDAVFITTPNVLDLARLALELRDVFARNSANLSDNFPIRTALDWITTPIVRNPITKKNSCMGPRMVLAARLEPVTPANSIFVTSRFAGQLKAQHPHHVTFEGEDSPGKKKPLVHLCKFAYKIFLPKTIGDPHEVYSLHHSEEEPPVLWEDKEWSDRIKNIKSAGEEVVDAFQIESVRRARAIGHITIDPWLLRDPGSRHTSALKAIKKCKPGDEVCFISITCKSVLLHAEPAGGMEDITNSNFIASAIDRGVKIRGIVFDPYCEEALFRSEIEDDDKPDPADRLLTQDGKKVQEIIKRNHWQPILEKIRSNLELRKAQHGITFGLWLFKDKAIIEPYHFGKTIEGKTQHMCLFSQFTVHSEAKIEFNLLKSHFENVWVRSKDLWPHIHGRLPLPLKLHKKLETELRGARPLSRVVVHHLVSNTLKIGERMQEAFDAISEPLNINCQTLQARKGENLELFVRTDGVLFSPYVLFQLHGIEDEERILEYLLAAKPKGHLIAYVHRPEELILRFAQENECDYQSAKAKLADLLKDVSAVVLSGKCFIEEYQTMLPEVWVTSIPLGFVVRPLDEQVPLESRLDPQAMNFIGSSTTWGEMRHLEDLSNLIAEINGIPGMSTKVTGYAAGTRGPRCDLDAFCRLPENIVISNEEIREAFESLEFLDEEGFRAWLREKASGRCIVRARKDLVGGYEMESIAELGPQLSEWENRLIDFNLQLYHEILDEKRDPDRRGLPKVEYSGTLHKGAMHEIFVVFDSPAMDDVERDEGFQMIKVPSNRGEIDFQTAALRIADLIHSPSDRRAMIEHNRESTRKLGMNEIAYAFCCLFRNL